MKNTVAPANTKTVRMDAIMIIFFETFPLFHSSIRLCESLILPNHPSEVFQKEALSLKVFGASLIVENQGSLSRTIGGTTLLSVSIIDLFSIGLPIENPVSSSF